MPKEIKSRDELLELHDDLQTRINNFLDRLDGDKESVLPQLKGGVGLGRVIQSLQESPEIQALTLKEEIKEFKKRIELHNSSIESKRYEINESLKILIKDEKKLERKKISSDSFTEDDIKRLSETKQSIHNTQIQRKELTGQLIKPDEKKFSHEERLTDIVQDRSKFSHLFESRQLRKDLKEIAKKSKREKKHREPADTMREGVHKIGETEMVRRTVTEYRKLKEASQTEKEGPVPDTPEKSPRRT